MEDIDTKIMENTYLKTLIANDNRTNNNNNAKNRFANSAAFMNNHRIFDAESEKYDFNGLDVIGKFSQI